MSDASIVYVDGTVVDTIANPGAAPAFTGASLYLGVGLDDVVEQHAFWIEGAITDADVATLWTAASGGGGLATAIQALGATVYWQVSEGSGSSSVADFSGNGHDATVLGGTLGVPGLVPGDTDTAGEFGAGPGEYVVSNDTFARTSTPFTLGLMVDVISGGSTGTLFGFIPPFGNPVRDMRLEAGTSAFGHWYNGTANDTGTVSLASGPHLLIWVFGVITGVAPTVSFIDPTEGPTTGGTTVTISGSDFTGATAVQFGGSNAASFTVDDDFTITAVSPAHSAGTVDVTVTTPGGTSSTSVDDEFTFTGAAITTGDYQWQLDSTLYGSGSNGLYLEHAIDGLGVPDAKTQDVVWAQRDGAYANPDYTSVRVITIPAFIRAATEADALTTLEALTLDWAARPIDAQLSFTLPGWGSCYVMGRPRSVKADLTHARRGVVRVLLRFDCPSPEVVYL